QLPLPLEGGCLGFYTQMEIRSKIYFISHGHEAKTNQKILTCTWFKKLVMNKNLGIMLLALGFTACNQEKVIESKDDIVLKPYPKTEKIDQNDDYFGTIVEDPYRWLEDDLSAETKQWVTAQNEVTQDYLGDRKSTRLNSSHVKSSYADFCLKKNTSTDTERE